MAALGLAALINRYIVDPLDAWRQSRVIGAGEVGTARCPEAVEPAGVLR
jgi:hypothetical protein